MDFLFAAVEKERAERKVERDAMIERGEADRIVVGRSKEQV